VPELTVDGGEIVGLAGESGSGKSMTILACSGWPGRPVPPSPARSGWTARS
jgi:ABC-type dipeptide/oligopeptide/nickel transport system ATPase component